MTQPKQLTPKELRHRWIVALESGFFKPNSTYLRVLSTTDYTYTHSPLGVLCAISNLGDFVPEESLEPSSRRKMIRHIFAPFERSYLPSANSNTKYDLVLNPPKTILVQAGLVSEQRLTWYNYHTQIVTTRTFRADSTSLPNLYKYPDPPYSIDTVMRHPDIPQAQKFPLLGEILRYLETKEQYWYAD